MVFGKQVIFQGYAKADSRIRMLTELGEVSSETHWTTPRSPAL